MLTPHDKLGLLALLQKVMDWLQNEVPTTTPCNLCRNWDCGRCQLADAVIPDDVKNVGCEQWDFDPNSPPI